MKRFRYIIGVVVLSVLLIVLRLSYFGQIIGWDEGVFAYIAQHWDANSLPYRDLIDIKLPGIFLFYKLCFFLFGTTYRAVLIGGSIFAVAGLWAYLALLWQLGMRRSAWWAGLCYVLMVCSPLIQGQRVQPELVMLFPTCLGLWFFLRYQKENREYLLWAAAVSISTAYFIKQFAAVLFLLVWYITWRQSNADRSARIRHTVGVCLSVLTGFYIAVSGFFISNQSFSYFWYWTHVRLIFYIGRVLEIQPLMTTISITLVLLAISGFIVSRLRSSLRQAVAPDEFILVWFCLTLVIISADFHFFSYYCIFLVPSLSLLLVHYAVRLVKSRISAGMRRLFVIMASLFSFSLWVLLTSSSFSSSNATGLFASYYRDEALVAEAAAYMNARTTPEDHVWSFINSAWLGWLSNRSTCTRFLMGAEHFASTFGAGQNEQEYVDEFTSCQPRYFLTKNTQDSLISEQLDQLITRRYQREVTMGYYDIFIRRD